MSQEFYSSMEKAPQRALLKALGLTDEELKKPIVAIVSAKSEIVPGHMHLDAITDAVKAGVYAGGCTPVVGGAGRAVWDERAGAEPAFRCGPEGLAGDFGDAAERRGAGGADGLGGADAGGYRDLEAVNGRERRPPGRRFCLFGGGPGGRVLLEGLPELFQGPLFNAGYIAPRIL